MQESINRYLPILAILLAAFLFVQTVGAIKGYRYIGGESMPSNVISVNGEGEVFAPADIATFSFGAEATAETVEAAQAEVSEKIDAALEKVRSFGVEDRDIKTSNYNVYPRYEYTDGICNGFRCDPGSQTLVGYEASQNITVKVRNVPDASAIIGAVGEAGATNISSLSFTIDDEDALKREARQMAILEAKEKAEALADDLDVRLVRIVSFYENEYGYPQPMMSMRAESAAMDAGNATKVTPSLPTGENTITSAVTITYEIR